MLGGGGGCGFCLRPAAVNLLVQGVRDHTVILPVINCHFSVLHLSNVPGRQREFMHSCSPPLSIRSRSSPVHTRIRAGIEIHRGHDAFADLPASLSTGNFCVSRAKSTPSLHKASRRSRNKQRPARMHFSTVKINCEIPSEEKEESKIPPDGQ